MAFWRFLFKIRILIAFIVIIIVFALLSPNFFRPINFLTIGMAVSILGIVAIGQTMCLLTGNFDLSVGQTVALSAVLTTMISNAGVPFIVIMPIIFCLGMAIGFNNATLITKAKINAFIVTLGMMTILQGIVYVITGGEYISTLASDFRFLGRQPRPIVYLLVLYAFMFYISRFTTFGRYIYAIGSNSESVKLAGLNVDKFIYYVYMLSGVLCSFAGMTLASRLGAASTGIGFDYPLQSIAAAVIGGVALTGGEGNVLMTLIGTLMIACINNGLILLNVPSSYQYLVTGVVLITAVLSDSMSRKFKI